MGPGRKRTGRAWTLDLRDGGSLGSNDGWHGSVDGVLACEPKGRWFYSQSGPMPGLWARSPVGGAQEATTH